MALETAPSSVCIGEVVFPSFISETVFPILPAFFEALGLPFGIERVRFSLNNALVERATTAKVTVVMPKDDQRAVFHLKRTARVDPSGFDVITGIDYERGAKVFCFWYIEELSAESFYPFLPVVKEPALPAVSRGAWHELSEFDQLYHIRRHIGRLA